ncbi:hypothetical protein [Ferruginibacter sp.]|nr:hypothetical protein [Ferruginibacter sp.]
MKIILTLCFFSAIVLQAAAQKESFDITTYTPPKYWSKEEKKDAVSYKIVDKKNKTWCQIGIYRSTATKGSAEQDFENDWQELIVAGYKITDAPRFNAMPDTDGWKIKSGGSKYVFNNNNAMVMLTTFSGYGKTMSIVAVTSSPDYGADIQNLIASVELSKTNTNAPLPNNNSNSINTSPGINSKGFTFSTSNFDDGWMAAEKTDWVELRKGDIKVLLHYANAVTSKYIPNRDVATKTAWDNLVAPKYGNLKNYFVFNNTLDPEAPFLVSGDVTENSTGKNVHVVLFNRGKSGMIEFICSDRNAFIKQFGIDQTKLEFYTSFESWEPLKRMSSYNKFAVANADFMGKWTNDFTGIQQYVNVYTGFDAGMSTYQSRQNFEFLSGNTYKWDLTVASGMVGNIKGKTTKAAGKFFVLSNWQIKCSDISGKPTIYNAYFSCVKGGRVLWLSDTSYPGYTAFGKVN